jgi:hypothetical protein
MMNKQFGCGSLTPVSGPISFYRELSVAGRCATVMKRNGWHGRIYQLTDFKHRQPSRNQRCLSPSTDTHAHTSHCTLVLFWKLSTYNSTDFLHLLSSRRYLPASIFPNPHRPKK